MGHLELLCPHCDKRLRLSDAHAGKTVRCPSCRNTFIAEVPKRESTQHNQSQRPTRESSAPQQPRRHTEPAPQGTRPSSSSTESDRAAHRPSRREEQPRRRQRQEFVDDDATPWDESNDIEHYDDSLTPRRSAAKRRKKSELPGKLLKIGLFVFLALLIIGGVGGLGYFAYRQPGSSGGGLAGNAVNMAWLPENVEAVMYVRPAEILSSPFAEKARQKFPIQDAMKLEGIAAQNVDYILTGFWSASGNLEEVPGAMRAIPLGLEGGWEQGSESLTVIRLSTAGIVPSGQQSGSYEGVSLYRDGSGKVRCLADSQTILTGSEKSVKEALDRKGKEFFQSKLSFIPTSGHLVLAGMGQSRPQSPTGLSQGNPAAELSRVIGSNTRCAAIIADFSVDVSITSTLLCHDAAGAEKIDTELKTGIETIRQQMGLISKMMPVPGLGDILKDFINTLIVSRDSDRLTIQGRIPSGIIDTVPAEGSGFSFPDRSQGQTSIGGGFPPALDEQAEKEIYKTLAYRRNAERDLAKRGLRGAAQMKDEYDLLKRGFMAQYRINEGQIETILAKGDSLGWPSQ